MYDVLIGWDSIDGDPYPLIQDVSVLVRRGFNVPMGEVLEFGWSGYDCLFKVYRFRGETKDSVMAELGVIYDRLAKESVEYVCDDVEEQESTRMWGRQMMEIREDAMAGMFIDIDLDEWFSRVDGGRICWNVDETELICPYVKKWT